MSPPNETPPAGEREVLQSSANKAQANSKVSRRPLSPEALNRKVITGRKCDFCKIREANWKSPTGHLACTQCRLSEIRSLLAKVDDAIGQLRFELCEVGALYVEDAS